MNRLSLEKRIEIVHHLVKSTGIRDTAELTHVSAMTVMKLLKDVGKACQRFHNERMRNLKCKRLEVDEIWTFVYSKQKVAHKTGNPEAGDAWTWVAIDADTRMIVSYYIGKRDLISSRAFMQDVKARLANRVQLTSDGHKSYLDAVEEAFEGNVDFAQLVKQYGPLKDADGKIIDKRERYLGADKIVISGKPDKKKASTSYVERQNLTMRTNIKRFTRETNAHSKKMEYHSCAHALHFVYYNFARIHQTLRVTPAMQAGIMERWMEIEDIVKLVDHYVELDK